MGLKKLRSEQYVRNVAKSKEKIVTIFHCDDDIMMVRRRCKKSGLEMMATHTIYLTTRQLKAKRWSRGNILPQAIEQVFQ